MKRELCITLALLFALCSLTEATEQAKPLKVFILAGQSNMEGHARIETFDYIGDDPATAPLLKMMRGADGAPAVCDHVWISYLTGRYDGSANGEGIGKLTAGFGARGDKPTQDGGKIGPEFTFGLTLDAAFKEPVLIIKTAWGGRSLNTEFRPPSAGPYEFSEAQIAQMQKQGKDIAAEKALKAKETGRFYRYMVEHVRKVLADPKRVCPAYDPAAGYEIAGFVWLQGFNDLVDGNTYPTGADGKTRDYTKYGEWLADFIRDVRKDLGAPKMPFVIGVLGVGGMKAEGNTVAFHKAMTAPSLLPEFKGNVAAVSTAPFWAEELAAIEEKRGKIKAMAATLKNKGKNGPNKDGTMTDAQQKEYLKKYEAEVISPEEAAKWTRGASNAGYHYLGCAKTFALMGKAFAEANLAMLSPTQERAASTPAATPVAEQKKGEMAGYLLVPNEKVPETFNAGFSMYISAWPLLKQYPGQRFQSGLPGTWMFAQPVGKPLEKGYSDIEGGLGWWRDTEYATETPKFIMGGVAPNFVEWANGPGAGKGRDWSKPNGKYAIAQLSPWVIWPPDGLNLKQGTRGEWFGYGYLPLPLAKAKDKTDGKDIPTGDQCWTLFLNSGNFKGPVTFFLPYFWSKAAANEPRFAGHLLDSRPSNPNRALQMETQHIPSVQATDPKGVTYARVTPTQFPSDAQGESALVHRITSYNKQALWDSVQAWFDGGAVASGAVNSEAAVVHEFPGRGGATWKIYPDGTEKDAKTHVAWTSFATPFAPDKNTFGYKWNSEWVKRDAGANGRDLIVLPEYFRLDKDDKQRPIWTPVAASEVPAETGLANANFDRKRTGPPKTYETPSEADSSWKQPGPKAGPFQARPGDGSVITYYWYRFADQPSLLNADMTDAEREATQQRVELLHRHWSKDRNYLAPPASSQLADLDPAMIVTPPAGLEVGYVPIVTRQEPAK